MDSRILEVKVTIVSIKFDVGILGRGGKPRSIRSLLMNN